MSAFKAVIPARFAAARLPGKPLVDIGGRAMVVRVAEQAALAGADEVLVATDDERIAQAVATAGHRAVLTAADHPSGSDRVHEVVAAQGWPGAAIVLNVQGDEPLAPPQVMRQLAAAMADRPEVRMATLCEPISGREELENPNVVKVVRNRQGLALYFSRAPIPWPRHGHTEALGGLCRRHVGIYGYRAEALARLVALPPSPLERTERLEQLRALECGLPILVLDACVPVPGGVDTPEDLQRVRRQFQAAAPSA